jgi:hypothetical protein
VLSLAFASLIQAQTLKVSTPMVPPNWVLFEREVLKSIAQSIEEFCSVYLDEQGYLLHSAQL